MGEKINVDSSDDACMFQFFKQFVHQTDKNEFYCDGKYSNIEKQGIEVDFQNIEYAYEVFTLLGNYWGGWNLTPTAGEMYDIAKNWEDRFGAEIIGLSYDSIEFQLTRKLSDNEIDNLIDECRSIYADAACSGGYEEMKKIIKDKSKLHIWWD